MDDPRILVVDDERRSVELLVRTLRDLGRVQTALSARDAWELAREEPLDLVVADQRMPEMTGVELLARIAERDERTGRILLTGYADIGATIDAINRGRVHAYVSKPFSPQELQLTARALLERVRGERERDRLLAAIEKRGPELLAVAPQAEERSRLAELLEPMGRVRAIAAAELLDAAPLVDCAAAVASLHGGQARALEELLPLRDLPAGRSLVLVVRELDEASLEEAIRRLDPLQVLTHPAPPPALRLAVQRALPAGPAGRGARVGQRRATVLLGVSAAIRELMQQIRQVAPLRVPVVVRGETGTGKELVARAIHQESPRAGSPFVAVNCGALPDGLLESELFGHVRGAFTGADVHKKGLFEVAHGGTLFLDEVGDMSPALQLKLLRVIEEQELRPVGGTAAKGIDVRIVSATHRDLEAALEEGRFRQDLFYRLNTVTIHVPPLRRRPVDIPFLAQHFAEEFGEAHAREIVLGEDLLEALGRHDYPGNVRELRNAIERAIALARPGEAISARHLERPAAGGLPADLPRWGTLRDRLERVELEAIREALQRFDGNRTHAAEALGLSRAGLREKMRRLGLEGRRRH